MPSASADAKRANLLYHDAAARCYDSKWSISFDERSVRYVRERAQRMLPRRRYGRVLEIGCGTGFVLLNMWKAGLVEEAHGCDLSPGMLAVAAENARTIGCDVRLRTADAEQLPFEDETFDLVVGHAVLHHLPSPSSALAEAHRVLRQGGALWISGEPTRVGHQLARASGRAAAASLGALARVAPRLRKEEEPPATEEERIARDLEFWVDLHTFEPDELAVSVRAAGFGEVRVETEELLSALVGWAVRTIEALARPGALGKRWASRAYATYRALYALDTALYPLLPKRWFYNALVYGEKPS